MSTYNALDTINPHAVVTCMVNRMPVSIELNDGNEITGYVVAVAVATDSDPVGYFATIEKAPIGDGLVVHRVYFRSKPLGTL